MRRVSESLILTVRHEPQKPQMNSLPKPSPAVVPIGLVNLLIIH